MAGDNCKICKQIIGNLKAICCDICNKWLHLKCTKLSQIEFDFHVSNELEFWRCDSCVPNVCNCQLVIKKNQKSLKCQLCKTSIHLQCSGITKKDLPKFTREKKQTWYCKWCLAETLPFSNIDTKKLINLTKKDKQFNIPENVRNICKICEKGNIIRKSAVYCKSCNSLLHRKCAQSDDNTTDLCLKCRRNSYPFQGCTNEEIIKDSYNSLESCKPCLDYHIEEAKITIKNTDLLNLFDVTQRGNQIGENNDNDINTINNINFKYYDLHEFHTLNKKHLKNEQFSLLHSNIESLHAKEDKLNILIKNLDNKFDVIALTETWNPEINNHKFCPPILEGYHSYEGITGSTMKGGCGFYIKNSVNYINRDDLDFKSNNKQHDFECKWIEMIGKKELENLIIGVHYRHPLKKDEEYIKYLNKILKIIKKENKNVIITGDFNYNLLSYQKDYRVNDFLSSLLENQYLPHVTGPTRITEKTTSLIDNIFFNNLSKECTSGNLLYKLSDHLPSFIFIDETKYTNKIKSNIYKRSFSKFNQEDFNEALNDENILENIKQTNNTNGKYEILHKHITNTLDIQAPYKRVTKKVLNNVRNHG